MTAPRREASPYNIFALTTICLGFFLSYADRQILSDTALARSALPATA